MAKSGKENIKVFINTCYTEIWAQVAELQSYKSTLAIIFSAIAIILTVLPNEVTIHLDKDYNVIKVFQGYCILITVYTLVLIWISYHRGINIQKLSTISVDEEDYLQQTAQNLTSIIKKNDVILSRQQRNLGIIFLSILLVLLATISIVFIGYEVVIK